jgi:serine/threonine-protein kinase
VGAHHECCGHCGFSRPEIGWLADPLPGLILHGRLRLEGRLGSGGMATVFRASRINGLGGHVAVKVLAPCFARTVIARRFEREAQIVSRLSSPHIVRLYEYDKFQLPNSTADLYYIAMELVDGQTLGDLLKSQGRVNFLWAIDVLRQLARGLEEAHGQGVVHRDLKPSNVMLVQQRGNTHVKILDFGIAAITEREEVHEKLTQTGIVSGTPDYMAPEQAVGDPVGPAADVYAMGLIAFEMLAGRRPFDGNAMTALMVRVTTAAPPLRSVIDDPAFPPDLCRIVDKMLDREPRGRYPHAGALLDDLGRFPTLQTTPEFVPPAELLSALATVSQPALKSPPSVAPLPLPVPPPSSAPPPARRSPKRWWLAAVLVGLVGTALALALVLPRNMPNSDTNHETPRASADPRPHGAAEVPPPITGPLPPLEPGFVESAFPLADTELRLALPAERVPLYRPLPVRLSWTRGGRSVDLKGGTLAISLEGSPVGTAHASLRRDGRLSFELPPRPLEAQYDLTLDLEGARGPLHVKFRFDAASQTLTPAAP